MLVDLLVTAITAVSVVGGSIENGQESMAAASNSSHYYTPPYTHLPAGEEDGYEQNNVNTMATRISPPDYCDLPSYLTTFSANLYDTTALDRDFYVFELSTRSNISFSIQSNTPSYSVNVSMARLTYYENSSFPLHASHYLDYFYEDYETSWHKTYSDTLAAGTYYIHVYGQQSAHSEIVIDYHIDLNVTIVEEGYDEFSPSEMRFAKGLPGAVWISDLVPGSFMSMLSGDLERTYFTRDAMNQDICNRDYALETLELAAWDDDIRAATVYIWDPKLKYCFYQTLKAFKSQVQTVVQQDDVVTWEINLARDIVSNCLKLAGTIGGLTVNSPIAGIGLDLLMDITDNLLNRFFDFLLPRHAIDYHTLLKAIDAMIDELEVRDINGNIMTNDYGDPQMESNGIFIFPISYRLFTEDNDCKLSYAPTYERIAESTNPHALLYSPDFNGYISSSDHADSYGCRGRLYVLDGLSSDLSNLTPVVDLDYVYPDVAETSLPCSYPGTAISSKAISENEYAWYDFVPNTNNNYNFLIQYESLPDYADVIAEEFVEPVGGYGGDAVFVHRKNYRSSGNDATTIYFIAFSKQLTAGEHFYLRIRGEEFQKTALVNIYSPNNLSDTLANAIHLSHEYGSYFWKSNTVHRATCSECGHVEEQPHAVASGATPDRWGYYRCLLCGGRAKFGFIQEGAPAVVGVSENGSVELESGIRVVVDDDLDSLQDGTLEFRPVAQGGHDAE